AFCDLITWNFCLYRSDHTDTLSPSRGKRPDTFGSGSPRRVRPRDAPIPGWCVSEAAPTPVKVAACVQKYLKNKDFGVSLSLKLPKGCQAGQLCTAGSLVDERNPREGHHLQHALLTLHMAHVQRGGRTHPTRLRHHAHEACRVFGWLTRLSMSVKI